jgi:hypothetical protein
MTIVMLYLEYSTAPLNGSAQCDRASSVRSDVEAIDAMDGCCVRVRLRQYDLR